MFTGDNLDVMRGMNSESVDLIYLDPPFNSNQNFSATTGSKSTEAAFKDTWTSNDINPAWQDEIANRNSVLHSVINTTRLICGEGMQSYLIMMSIRILEMNRILKETGSIYLHCDTTASHYLKLIMDATFGEKHFQNQIVWKRHKGRSDGNRFGRVYDTILYYTKGERYTWNDVFDPLDSKYIQGSYGGFDQFQDKFGPFMPDNLTGPNTTHSESGQTWKGVNPTASGRCWSVPKHGNYAHWINENITPDYLTAKSVSERLDVLEKHGLIIWPEKLGGMPRLKRYLAASRGAKVNDVITNILRVDTKSIEWTGYPTEKPVPLLQHIIQASSNKNDMVLDPFCGSATTCIVANRLNRKWAGIDLSPIAARLVKERMKKEGALLYDLVHREDIPIRTDIGQSRHCEMINQIP